MTVKIFLKFYDNEQKKCRKINIGTIHSLAKFIYAATLFCIDVCVYVCVRKFVNSTKSNEAIHSQNWRLKKKKIGKIVDIK